MTTPEDLENFMLKHGENIIDTLGAEVDRLEKELKVRVWLVKREKEMYFFAELALGGNVLLL